MAEREYIMKNVLLWIWQFPQNLFGMILRIIIDCERDCDVWLFSSNYISSFSLGNYIFVNRKQNTETTRKHEKGHQLQSRYLGLLYLLAIGLPSLYGNMQDRIFHKDWARVKRIKWYYSQPWEKLADRLGNVNRLYCR